MQKAVSGTKKAHNYDNSMSVSDLYYVSKTVGIITTDKGTLFDCEQSPFISCVVDVSNSILLSGTEY
ncbi:hypothetical protein GCM10028807_09880 [Spirosoma daeguense]